MGIVPCPAAARTQWYILFNVIAGASAIPTDLKEVCGCSGWEFRALAEIILAGNFYIPNHGFITASAAPGTRASLPSISIFKEKRCPPWAGRGDQPRHRHGKFRVLLAATICMRRW